MNQRVIEMPTCPNCGSYIPLGNHSCSCGTTIRYVDDVDEEKYEKEMEFQSMRRRHLKKLQTENPYDDDFFNELHHNAVSPILVRNMNDQISILKNNFNATLEDAEIFGHLAIFTLKVTEKLFDATFKATFDMANAFNDVVVVYETVTPDFSRLYSNEEFRKLIKSTERKTGYKFKFCKAIIVGYEVMVSAYFDNGGAWTVDLDDMSLV